MKIIILIGSMICVSCGVSRPAIDAKSIEKALAKGQTQYIEPSVLQDHLQMEENLEATFQLFTLQKSPNTIHRINFDTNITKPVTGPLEEDCINSAKTFINFSNKQIKELQIGKVIALTDTLKSISYLRTIGNVGVKGAFLDCTYSKKSKAWKLHSIVNNTFFHLPIDFQLPLDKSDIDQLLNEKGQVKEIKGIFLPMEQKIVSATLVNYQLNNTEQTYIFDSLSGKILEAFHHNLAASRVLVSKVYRRNYMETGLFQAVLPLTPIYFGNQKVVSSLDGHFSLAEYASTIELDSQRVQVYNQDNGEPIRLDSFSVSNDAIQIDESGDQKIGVNTYTAIHRINKFVRQFISPVEVPFLDFPLEARINLSGTCNAFYTTGKKVISLFSQGDGCANIGEVNDVIYHEWGHALDEHTGRTKGVQDGAFSEGLADFISALYNEDPRIGVGFVEDEDTGIRSIDKFFKYPENVGEVHEEGGIIAGAFWELYQSLVIRYGKIKGKAKVGELFFRHLLITDSYLESYNNVLLVDDDDGNLATPSPNFCIINDAFAKRGLAKAASCSDKPNTMPKADNTLSLALYDIDDNRVSLVGSSELDGVFSICLGSRRQCLYGNRAHFELPFLTSNGDLRFYAYQGPITLGGVDHVTLLLKGPQGQIFGSRHVKIVTK